MEIEGEIQIDSFFLSNDYDDYTPPIEIDNEDTEDNPYGIFGKKD